jgi:hypothetical protein
MSIDDSFLLTSSSAAMSLCKRSPGRPRLPDDVRIANIRASKKAWADKHQAYVRDQIARLHARPEYRARRAELYRLKRVAWMAAGGVPGHRGRPRLDPPETAAGDACCARTPPGGF